MTAAVKVGDTLELSRTVREDDLEQFARLSLDRNPIHFDDNFASATYHGKRVAHGMLGAALISGGLTELMGPGNLWLGADISFKNPIFIGDTLLARLSVQSIDRRGVAELEVKVTNDRDELVVDAKVKSLNFAARRKREDATE